MSKIESTEMESIDSKAHRDESLCIDIEDGKKNQIDEQNDEMVMKNTMSYKNLKKNIREHAEKSHAEVLLYLNSINIGIGDSVRKKEGKRVTVLRIILENVSNGHDLILQILDSLVKKIPKNKCSKCLDSKKDDDAKIEIEVQPLFQLSSKSTDQTEFARSKMRLIRDLFDIQSTSGGDNKTSKLLQHPVIEILILKKWQNHQWSYIGSVRFFALIVFLFTFFVRLKLIEEDENRCINASTSKVSQDCVDYLVNRSDLTSGWMNSTDETTRPFYRLLIFKYKETSFGIFAFAMTLVVFTQLFYLMWVVFEECTQCKKRKEITAQTHQRDKRKVQFLKINFMNMVYFSLVISLVCISSPRPTLKRYILVFWISLLLAEVHQVCFLILRPAWQGLNFKFLKPVLQHRYFRDPENYLELFCIISIPIAIYSDAWSRNPKDEHDENDHTLETEAVFRGVVAIGVFAAWTELFIKLGNVSHSVVGDFTKMFYNIIKTKLLAYMQVCILLIVAFSLAFWIILEGNLKEDGEDFSKGFWFNLVLTVTMSTGEFNTGEFYKNIIENGVIKVFAMLFLIGLVILSTITMINLLVAAIISDYQKMKASVDMENLCFITEYIIEAEERKRLNYQISIKICTKFQFAMTLYNFFVNDHKDQKKITHCPHLICNQDVCKSEPLPIAKPGWSYNQASEAEEREPLLLRLLEIRKGKEKYKIENEEENFCDFHKYGLQWDVNDDSITCVVDDNNRTKLEMKTNTTAKTKLSTLHYESTENYIVKSI